MKIPNWYENSRLGRENPEEPPKGREYFGKFSFCDWVHYSSPTGPAGIYIYIYFWHLAADQRRVVYIYIYIYILCFSIFIYIYTESNTVRLTVQQFLNLVIHNNTIQYQCQATFARLQFLVAVLFAGWICIVCFILLLFFSSQVVRVASTMASRMIAGATRKENTKKMQQKETISHCQNNKQIAQRINYIWFFWDSG